MSSIQESVNILELSELFPIISITYSFKRKIRITNCGLLRKHSLLLNFLLLFNIHLHSRHRYDEEMSFAGARIVISFNIQKLAQEYGNCNSKLQLIK